MESIGDPVPLGNGAGALGVLGVLVGSRALSEADGALGALGVTVGSRILFEVDSALESVALAIEDALLLGNVGAPPVGMPLLAVCVSPGALGTLG